MDLWNKYFLNQVRLFRIANCILYIEPDLYFLHFIMLLKNYLLQPKKQDLKEVDEKAQKAYYLIQYWKTPVFSAYSILYKT
ncbi:hypothetical protein [Gillisia sp. Hel_I_86]|uniref:hypothetical protein n=1 Tax=Gillisia sp. Hel_I_86 TaxID=1249981 RepID=UPI0016480166|nr:hypothetical protein [Gillisia sp. Hel_I_86]